MENIQQNIIYFCILGAGFLIISLFLFYTIFADLQFLNSIIALTQLQLPPNASNAFIVQLLPHKFELFATLISLAGIGVLIFTIGYLLSKDFDWNELWMKYSMSSLIIGVVIIAIGLIIIYFKRMLVPIYILLTVALGNWGWLGYYAAPFNLLDAIVPICVGIGFIISIIVWIFRYPPYY